MNSRTINVIGLSLVVLGTACEATTDSSSAPRDLDLQGAPIQVLDFDPYSIIRSCSAGCVYSEYFWVDVAVRNDAFDKQVAIRWTDDDWATYTDTPLQYEGSLQGGFERWGTDVELGLFSTGAVFNPPPEEVEFAAYVTMNGQTWWDPDNDYYVYGKVTEEEPVTLLESDVGYDQATGAFLQGRVRVFDLAPEKRVFFRYTTDDWATWEEAEAAYAEGDDWSFRIDGLGLDSLPEAVEFAIRYEVDGETYWDSNDGRNYRRTLEPNLDFTADYEDEPLSGLLDFGIRASGDLEVEQTRARLDDGPWVDGGSLSFSTLGLDDGPHQVFFEVTVEGGYQVQTSQDFDVFNAITPLPAWTPAFGIGAELPGSGSSWGFAVDDAGRIALHYDAPYSGGEVPFRGIVRFEQFGGSEPTVFEPLPTGDSGFAERIQAVTIDDEGRVYGLVPDGDAGIYRWTEDGRLDSSFGEAGKRVLDDAVFPDRPIAFAHGEDALWVIGRCFGCDDTLLRYAEGGSLLDSVTIPSDVMDDPSADREAGAITYDDGAAWLLLGRSIVRATAGAGGLQAERTVVFEDGFSFNLTDSLVRTEDGTFFAVEGAGNRLVAISPSGAILGTWFARANLDGLHELGAVHVATGADLLPDGRVVVLDAQQGRVVPFSSELR